MSAVFFSLAFCCALRLFALMCCFRGGCVAWLGSGLARGRAGLGASALASTPPQDRPLCGNRESSRRPSTRHIPLQWRKGIRSERSGASHRTVAMCAGAGPIRGGPRISKPDEPRNRLCRAVGSVPRRGKPRSGAGGDSNAWAGERACRHRPGARSQSETELNPTRQDEATRCTVQPPTPEPPTVPRETPTPRVTRQPAHPQGVCPSSPSTPRPVSAPDATRW